MVDFPSGVAVGYAHTVGGRTWVWNGTGWERQINYGQSNSAFASLGVEVQTLAALPATAVATWHLINYV